MSDNNINEYPRPDWARPSPIWESLSDGWDLVYDDQDAGLYQEWYQPDTGLPENKKRKIQVPFVHQTPASGINEQQAQQVVWYQTRVSATQRLIKKNAYRTILHFGAVDYHATVWLNGVHLGTHRGGHVPFEFDVTGKLDEREPATLTIRVWDAATDLTQPRGKQYWAAKPEGIFYTPSTGIWQPVWIEHVPLTSIADSSHGTILRSHNIESGQLEAEVSVLGKQKSQPAYIVLLASLAGVQLTQSKPVPVDAEKDIARLKLDMRLTMEQISKLPKTFTDLHSLNDQTCWRDNLALWSPEHPILYDLTIQISMDEKFSAIQDEVHTTIGMRSLSWSNGDGTFQLNGKPYFQALVLDQGYWPSTNMTPPTSQSCREDIVLAKAMGFNGCRKHQKIESPEFLYWADHLGFLVWGEMANGYEFSSQYVERFDQEWMEAVRRDINHPCIVTWTPVNETWGYGDLANDTSQQNHIRSLYYQTKTLDPTRPINDNCGWEHVATDLTTFHDYSDGPQLAEICKDMTKILDHKAGRAMFVGGAEHKEGTPVLCTEFGGVNIALKQGEKGVDGEWGYTTATDSKDLLERVKRLMLGVVEGGHCCGFVYTQLTDIEQETNGLYTFDRTEKLPAAEVKKIIEEVKKVYFEKLEQRRSVKV